MPGGHIVNPTTGALETRETITLSPEDAHLLRQYKQFLQRYGLKEALYCNACWEQNLHHGCEASVTDARILILCRCAIRTYTGV